MINCEAFLCLENEFESRTLELSHPGANGGISKSYFTLYLQPLPINIKVTGSVCLCLSVCTEGSR